MDLTVSLFSLLMIIIITVKGAQFSAALYIVLFLIAFIKQSYNYTIMYHNPLAFIFFIASFYIFYSIIIYLQTVINLISNY